MRTKARPVARVMAIGVLTRAPLSLECVITFGRSSESAAVADMQRTEGAADDPPSASEVTHNYLRQ